MVLQVEFKLFGLIPGYVGLRGKFEPVDGSQDTVKVNFEPAVLNFADRITFALGRYAKS